MKSVIFSLLVIILSVSSARVSAQNIRNEKFEVRGRIIDSSTLKPLAFVSLTISNENGIPVTTGFSNDTGAFNITVPEAGRYTLAISIIGFQERNISVQVSTQQPHLNLGIISLSSVHGNLSEVKIAGRKKLIEQLPGKIVYNAANDIISKGGTAADVLRKAPVLQVDAQGNVSMRGNSNLKILINGKQSGQMARSPADALQMMPAEIIQSVEIITTPSAKYDAEGAAGVINIITKKGRTDFNGALELSAGNMEQMFNPRINYSTGKWNLSFHGHLHRFRIKEEYELKRSQFDNGNPASVFYQSMQKDNSAPHGSGNFVIQFTPDSVSEFSIDINTWFGKWPDNRQLQTRVSAANGDIIENYFQTTTQAEKYLGTDITIGYNRKLKKPGRELTLLALYQPGRSTGPYQTWQTDIAKELLYEEINDNKTRDNEWTVQADFVEPLSADNKHSLETGVKLIMRNASNNYEVFANENPGQGGQMEPVASRTDIFSYHQNVWAAYLMGKSNFSETWYAEAGARIEYTDLGGDFKINGSAFGNNFINFIPTATASAKLNEKNSFSLSYTQRLTRPYIWDLNPNADASDPKNIVSGNPALKPEIAHQLEFVYAFNKGSGLYMNASLYGKYTNNAITEITRTDNDGIATTTKENLSRNESIGLNLSGNGTIIRGWSANGNININYLKFSGSTSETLNKGWAADLDLNSTVSLPRSFSIQVFGQYSSRLVTLQGNKSSQFYYSMAVKKNFPVSKFVITLAAVNPFNRYISQKEEIRGFNFVSTTANYYFLRAFKLTLNWEFGGAGNNRERKRITNDDIKGGQKG